MSDPNPPERPSFNQPASSDPTTPMPTGGPASPTPGGTPTPASSSSTQPSSPPPSPSSPPPPPPPPAPPGGGSGRSTIPDPSVEGAGFFRALFDFSFTNFVTPMLVRFVYLLATAALVATWLVFLFASFARDAWSGLVVLILGPVFLIIYLAVIRMTLEFYLSVVRMSEDVHRRLPQA